MTRLLCVVIGKSQKGQSTHTNNSGVVGHWRRLLWRCRSRLLDAQILHIAASEDNELVNLLRALYFLCWVRLASFCAMRLDILQGDGRLGWVDLDEGADIAVGGVQSGQAQLRFAAGGAAQLERETYRMSLFDIKEMTDLLMRQLDQ